MICIKDDDTKSIVEEVCKNISFNDSTFNYSIFRAKYGKCKYILKIVCSDEDEAFKKGDWFNHKVDSSLWFWVRK